MISQFSTLGARIGRSKALIEEMLNLRAPVRPTVLIQSDDWGRVGIPSLRALEELERMGYAVGTSLWDRYGLETVEDVDALVDTLCQFRDRDGRHPCVTANFVLCNADLRRMAACGWREFFTIPISDGFPAPWDDDLMPAYRRAILAGAFSPALHGFTHFNIPIFMKALSHRGNLGLRARTLAERDVPYLRSVTPEYNFALSSRDASGEHYLSGTDQGAWLEAGIRLFRSTFGVPPLSACLPGYRANAAGISQLGAAGIRVIEQGESVLLAERNGVLLLGRNVAFEPVLHDVDQVKSAEAQAIAAVAAGLPIVICSHSINYVARFVAKAEFGRSDLARLLGRLCKHFPDLRFASDRDFLLAWVNGADDWFRKPSAAERAERLRRFLATRLRRYVSGPPQPVLDD